MQLLAGSLKNFHISLPLMEPIHMVRCTAREDREHVHTEKTWSGNEMVVKEMSKTAMKRV